MCDVCGSGLSRSNRFGVCTVAPECRAEYGRRSQEHMTPEQLERRRKRDCERRRKPEWREWYRQYYDSRADKLRAATAEWREAHKDDPEVRRQYREHWHRRRAMKRAVPNVPIDEQALYVAQNGLCGVCSEPLGETWHLDHVFPLSRGGWHTPANAQLTHPVCNMSKGAKVEWNRETIARIVAMVNTEACEGYQFTLSLGSFTTSRVEESAPADVELAAC